MTFTNKRSLIAFLLSLVLVVSLFTIGISAETGSSDVTSTEATEVESNDGTESNSKDESESETKAESSTKAETKAETEAKAETEDPDVVAKRAHVKKTLIINGIIIGVIVLIIVLLAVKFRKKLGDFLRSVKSELKKIVWSSKENTRKSFLVVIVVAVAIAVLLFLVDFAFTSGLGMIYDLVQKLGK